MISSTFRSWLPRPARIIRRLAIAFVAVALVVLLPVAPAQPPARDLGAVRTASAPASELVGHAAAAAGAPRPDLPYHPFIDPVPGPVHSVWYVLLLPMAFGIAVVYKAVMLKTMDRYWSQVAFLTAQIVVGMVLLAGASYVLVMVYVPYVAG